MFVSRKEFKKQLQEFSKQNQECQELIQTLQQQLLELAYEVDVVNEDRSFDGDNNKQINIVMVQYIFTQNKISFELLCELGRKDYL